MKLNKTLSALLIALVPYSAQAGEPLAKFDVAEDISRFVSPLVSAIRTASLRNSSVRSIPIVHLLCCNKCYQRSGIKPRQVHFEL
jgi:hypothetical protein